MSKVSLVDVGNLEAQTSARANINANSDTIESAFDNTLSLDGTSPNALGANIDMNGFTFLNLPIPVNDGDAVRLVDLRATNGALTPSLIATISNVPTLVQQAQAAATAAASYVGAATQAPKLSTARTITYTGAATGSFSFDGSANVSCNLTLAAGQAVANIGYTPANKAGDNFTGAVSVNSQRVVRVASGTGTNSGLISWGTANPTGTPDDGQIYFKLSS